MTSASIRTGSSTRWKKPAIVAIAMGASLLLASCSGGGSTPPPAGEENTSPIKVGLIASQSGKTSFLGEAVKAFEARIALENEAGGIEGRSIEAIIADDASNGEGALAAARSLVLDDKVAMVGNSSIWSFGAAEFLNAEGIPTIGYGADGPHWAASPFFAVNGSLNPKQPAATTRMKFLADQGCKSVALLGLVGSPLSLKALNSEAVAAEAVGMTAAYTNGQVPFDQTDYTPLALEIKESGAECINTMLSLPGNLALAKALEQAQVKVKHSLYFIGFGEAALMADQAALAALEGAFFDSRFAPLGLNNASTQVVAEALKTHAGKTGEISSQQMAGWLTADLMIEALKVAGPDADSAALLAALEGMTSWDGGGILPQPINWTTDFATGHSLLGPGLCQWVAQLRGGQFEIVSPKPICGALVPGSEQA